MRRRAKEEHCAVKGKEEMWKGRGGRENVRGGAYVKMCCVWQRKDAGGAGVALKTCAPRPRYCPDWGACMING